MEIEILSKIGKRPVQIMMKDDGKIYAVTGDGEVNLGSYKAGKKCSISVEADVAKSVFSVKINNKKVVKDAKFAESAKELQRVSFRTGEYRKLGIGKDENAEDLPNAGEPVAEAIYYVDNVKLSK
jgi:hypothetical protein